MTYTNRNAPQAANSHAFPGDVLGQIYEQLGARERVNLAASCRDTYAKFKPNLLHLKDVKDSTRLALEPRCAARRKPHLRQRCLAVVEPFFGLAGKTYVKVKQNVLRRGQTPIGSTFVASLAAAPVCAIDGIADVFGASAGIGALGVVGTFDIASAAVKTSYRRSKDRRDRKALPSLAVALETGDLADAERAVKDLKPTNTNLTHLHLPWGEAITRLEAAPEVAPKLRAFISRLPPEVQLVEV